MSSRRVLIAFLSPLFLFAGCSGDSQRSTPQVTPIAPSPLPAPLPPAPSPLANWRGNATVLSVTNPGHSCGWGTSTGDVRNDVDWRITITGGSISLEEDMRNWPTDHIPFSGTLTNRQFTASYANGDDYLRWVCQFKGATLSGTFSADFSSFEAFETLVWGPPGGETTVQRRWIGSRLQPN